MLASGGLEDRISLRDVLSALRSSLSLSGGSNVTGRPVKDGTE